jgi:integrase
MKMKPRAKKPPRRLYLTKGASLPITQSLVDHAVDHLAANGTPDELVVRDTALKGFVVRLRATGHHVFGASYGRGKFLTLGASDRLTAGKARLEAREALAQNSLDGIPVRAERKAATLTLERFLDEHYVPWAEEHLKTAAETLTRIRGHFYKFLDTRIVDLTPFAIERWKTSRLKAGKARATVNRDVVALKAAISRAVEWGLLKVHPLASVKPYKVDSKAIIRYLTPDEESRLMKALGLRDDRRRAARESGNQWRRERGYAERPPLPELPDHITAIVVVGLHTGLRRGELFGLRWRDVDQVRAIVTVRGAGAKSGTTRHVPLNATAAETLAKWGRDKEQRPDAIVFPGLDGEPLEDIKSAWLPLVKAAKLTNFRFHDLRHTFASKLVQAGVDLNTVRELLGHGDIQMTLRYAHLAPEMKAAAVAKLVSA